MGVARSNFRPRHAPSAAAVAALVVLWDSVNKSSDITISGGGLVATFTGGGGTDALGRADTAIISKSYWECEITNETGGVGFGIANGSAVYGSGNWLGETANVMGFYPGGDVYQDYNSIFAARFGGFPTYAAPTGRAQFAFDPVALKIWMRADGGAWNNNAGANDPAAGTGGIAVNSSPILMGTGPFYPAYNVFTGGSVATLKADPASWNNSAPAGYGQVGA